MLGDAHVHPVAAVWSVDAHEASATRFVPQRCSDRDSAIALAGHAAAAALDTGDHPWVRDADGRVLSPAYLRAFAKARGLQSGDDSSSRNIPSRRTDVMTNSPFEQGAQAFLADAPTASCTFPNGSTMQREWLAGWSQRQVRERAHRSRMMAQVNIHDRLGEPSAGAMSKLFHPVDKMD